MGLKAICRRCKTTIHSQYRHDWKQCKCKSIYVDGGNSYFRGGFPTDGEDVFIEITHNHND